MEYFNILNKKSKINIDKWQKLSKKSQYTNKFHIPEMFDFYESVPNFSPKIIPFSNSLFLFLRICILWNLLE